MPSDAFLKVSNRVHHGLLALSGGRLGWRVAKMPVLRLTTTGRRSGEPRTVMLTSPHEVGDAFVVVASRGGDDHHPAWFLNLLADPEVRVQTSERPPHPRVARVASADERAEWWPIVVERYAGYGRYQERTGREIPLVFLETVPGDGAAG